MVDTNGAPVAGVTLELDNQSISTDSNGDFAVTVPSGMTTVSYYREVGQTSEAGNAFGGSFEVDLSSRLTNQVLTIPATVNLTIQVTDPGGNPVAGAQIYPPEPNWTGTSRVRAGLKSRVSRRVRVNADASLRSEGSDAKRMARRIEQHSPS